MKSLDLSESPYLSLPEEAQTLLDAVNAPPRLVAHLTLVHDVSVKLASSLESAFPSLQINREDFFFGAAIHDIGKAVLTEELTAPGHAHERCGFDLLIKVGVPERRARFAWTHANWGQDCDIDLTDLLVALADKCWKGKREPSLESAIVNVLVRLSNEPEWQCFLKLDEIVQEISDGSDTRLHWQEMFSPCSVKSE